MLRTAMDFVMQAVIWMAIPAVASTMQQEPFRPVEGSSLSERLATAVRQSKADSAGKSFWTAYTFDVRSGFAVDIGLTPAFQGRVEAFGGTEVFFGTLNGTPANTRNLAIFTLHAPGSESVTRLQIWNLDKQRPSDGNPVYWLGRATKDESLNDLRRLAESGRSGEIRARATLAVALHDDPRVGEMLKNLVLSSTDAEVRAISISWLGQTKSADDFLADLGRKASETETRVATINAIARNKNGDTFATLRSFYHPDLDPKVKMALIDAIANASDKDAVALFLLDLEEHDPVPAIKQHVIYTLRRFDGTSTINELMRLFQAERDESFKNQILYALSQMPNPLAVEKLFEVARQNDNPRIRRQARYLIHDRIRQRVAKEERKATVRSLEDEFEATAERILCDRSPSEAVTMFTETAKTNPNLRVRMMAVFYLSKIDDPRVLDFYSQLLSE